MLKLLAFYIHLKTTFRSIFKLLLQSKFRKSSIPFASRIRNIVLLGNGPSLNQTLLIGKDFLLNNDLLCVNAFSLSPEYVNLKPIYYVIADPQFWKKNPIDGVDDMCKKIVSAIIEKTNWPLTLFTPYESAKFPLLKELKKNKNITICFYNKTTVYGFSLFQNLCYKYNLGIPRAQNVLIPSLIFAINMGYKNVFITGADHSWHENLSVSDKNVLLIRDEHFYDNEHQGYRPIRDVNTGRNCYLHEQFSSLAIVFEIYHKIKQYSAFRDSQVYNASEKTYIDAFDRYKINNE
jgi:hypothetical protein